MDTNKEIDDYQAWIEGNKDHILECYVLELGDSIEFPEHIYEDIHKTQYVDSELNYEETCTIDDVTDEFISDMYNKYLESEGDLE